MAPSASEGKNEILTRVDRVPSGFKFGVATVDVRGYFMLDKDVLAGQETTYFWKTTRDIQCTSLVLPPLPLLSSFPIQHSQKAPS
jgi:hypothetical protein